MNTIRRFLWFIPTVIWMAVIFNFSAQDAEVSSGLSYKVTAEVADVLHSTVMADRSRGEIIELLHPYVRKAAHMAEYAILYVLLFLSFFFSMLATRSAAVSIVISLIYACIDELHQTFVSGRSGEFTDVCVDMTGVLLAVALILFIYSAWQGRHLRKEERIREREAEETDEQLRMAREEGARLERARLRHEMQKRREQRERER